MQLTTQYLPLTEQIAVLTKIVQLNTELMEVLYKSRELAMSNWYIGAGAIAQTVWNYFHKLPLNHGVKDYDLVYFDADTSESAQRKWVEKGKNLFKSVSKEVEITNQARVHLWYQQEFGVEMLALASTEQGISTWPTTSTAIGIRLEHDNQFTIYAPYGLHDLLGLIVKANKVKITEQVYLEKVTRWSAIWPELKIIPWCN